MGIFMKTHSPFNPLHTPTDTKYTPLTRLFHHGSIVLLVGIWALAQFKDSLSNAMGYHKALGVVFLLWVLARSLNKLFGQKHLSTPSHLTPFWQIALAKLVHIGLYVCMLAMPIVGVLMSVYGGRAVQVFGFIQIPVFVTPNRELSKWFNELHTEVIFPMLVVLIGLHVAGAIYHQFVLKDNLLSRIK